MFFGNVWQLDIFVEFEVDSSNSSESASESRGCGDGAVDRSTGGPFGLLVLADDSLSELTPIYFRISNTTTSFCADETRFSSFKLLCLLNSLSRNIMYFDMLFNFMFNKLKD